MSKNKARRSGEAVAAMHRNAGPMRHRLALRGNPRTKAEAEALNEYESERDLDYNELACAMEY